MVCVFLSAGAIDFPSLFGPPGTAVAWEDFAEVLVRLVSRKAAAEGGERVALLRTVLQQIRAAKS